MVYRRPPTRPTATASEALSLALATINAPRPEPIGGATLLRTLFEPDERWRPHVEALFDEVPRETLHALVLSGATTFAVLAKAQYSSLRWSCLTLSIRE